MQELNFGSSLKEVKDDGMVSPVINETICPEAEPKLYPAPATDFLGEYGFSFSLEIEPREWEKDKILKIVYPEGGGSRIRPDKDFAAIMDAMRKEAVEKYGYMP